MSQTRSRPCNCDRCDTRPGAKWDSGQCRKCWLYHHDHRYRARWGGEAVANTTCVHRTQLAHRWQPCPSCPAGIPVHLCSHPTVNAECLPVVNTEAKKHFAEELGITACYQCSHQQPISLPVKPVATSYPCKHRRHLLRAVEDATCNGQAIQIYQCGLNGKECAFEHQIDGCAVCAACAHREPYEGELTYTEEEVAVIRRQIEGPARTMPDHWVRAPVVEEAHRRVLSEILQARMEAPGGFSGDGIVTLGGGAKYFTSAFVMIHMLRKLGCKLPIELCVLDHRELDDEMERAAQSLGDVRVRYLSDELSAIGQSPRSWGGWQAKIYAIIHSSFQRVLWLDSDQHPVKDPTYLFHGQKFIESGAVLWPDHRNHLGCSVDAQAFRTCGLPIPGRKHLPGHFKPSDYRPVESGQVLIDKSKCWHALEVCRWMNDHADYFYGNGSRGRNWLVYGDKDTFYLAFEATKTPYYMPRQCHWAGTSACGAFLQFDEFGEVVFQHRTMPTTKWSLHEYNPPFAGQLNYDLAVNATEALQTLWSGNIHATGDLNHGMAAKQFIKRRPDGTKHRIALLPSGAVAGDTDGATSWNMRNIGGKRAMVVRRQGSVLHIFNRNGAGWFDAETGYSLTPEIAANVACHDHDGDRQLYYDVRGFNEYRLKPRIPDGAKVLDVGANQGFFAMACLDRGEVNIVAVEPAFLNVINLQQNLVDRVVIHQKAVTRSDAAPRKAEFGRQSHDDQSGGINFFDNGKPREGAAEMVGLDQFLDHPVDLLKIDIEGYEWPALYGSKKLANVSEICGEYHLRPQGDVKPLLVGLPSQDVSVDGLRRFLEGLGFTVHIQPHAIVGDQLGLFWAFRTSPSRFFDVTL